MPRPPTPFLRPLLAALLLGATGWGCARTAPGSPAALPSASGSAAVSASPRIADAPVFPTSNRPEVRGTRGAVTSDHPLASATGLQVLAEGGSAVDAAIATAAVLAVVRPHMNGIGGDAFALFWDAEAREVTALNGSGAAGELGTPEFFDEMDGIPYTGAASVSVPGTVAAWTDAHARYGRLPLARLLAPAIRYAREGFPVTTRLAADFRSQGGDLAPEARSLFLPRSGGPPEPGTLLRNPALAATLERIAAEGAAGFYEGPVARAIGDFVAARGGYLRAGDLATHRSEWVEPLSIDYLGHTFLVLPPNTQGLAQLQQMEMAKSFDINGMDQLGSSHFHTLIELKKLAFADRERWVADPHMAKLPVAQLLDPAYLAERARRVDPERAAREVEPGLGDPIDAPRPEASDPLDDGDTVYLTVVDADGNAVSWIQSLYAGFGSGLLEPETGVVLQNRGALFTLEPGHPNRIAPGKRPFHTLTPTMALRDGNFAFTLGTPGGDSQTQSILQIVHHHLLFGMTPQEAVEAPRFRSHGGLRVSIEDRISPAVRAELEARGHELTVVSGWTATFGGAQMIVRDPRTGALVAAADPRREAYAIAH